MRLRRGIYTPFGVCCGFGQAFRGPVCNPLCGITSLSVPVFPGCHSLLVASYSPGRATPRDTLAFRGVTLSSGAENPGLDVSCTQGSWRPTLVPPPASCGEERRMCAFPLNCHTTSGSFQRDSAGAGHSCHRFCLHDRRASYSSQCLDAPAIWCSVFPQSAPWPLEHIV